jgi:hypothetical protein
MKIRVILFISGLIIIGSQGCAPFDKIYSHDFSSGYFRLKDPVAGCKKVYVELSGDSLAVYSLRENSREPDLSSLKRAVIGSLSPGDFLYKSTFIKTSPDVDLSTILLKFRPAAGNVPAQLSANVNGIFYVGFRKDFYRMTSHLSPAHTRSTFIRQLGFDFGPFAGIGITPVNPTTTMFKTDSEYDGIVFQKGFALFGTFENMSVGITLGFDNLTDRNKDIWVFNRKPWIGIAIGIANF